MMFLPTMLVQVRLGKDSDTFIPSTRKKSSWNQRNHKSCYCSANFIFERNLHLRNRLFLLISACPPKRQKPLRIAIVCWMRFKDRSQSILFFYHNCRSESINIARYPTLLPTRLSFPIKRVDDFGINWNTNTRITCRRL